MGRRASRPACGPRHRIAPESSPRPARRSWRAWRATLGLATATIAGLLAWSLGAPSRAEPAGPAAGPIERAPDPAAVGLAAPGPEDPRPDVAEIVARCEPSVAVVEGRRGTGTGFLVRRHLLVTNSHVVAGEADGTVRVRFPSAPEPQRGPFDAELISQDPGRDLAFFAIRTDLPPLPLATSYRHLKGEDVLVIGSPSAGPGVVLENAVSRGVMSTRAVIDGRAFHQLNIAVNPGNSGGPVLDLHGRIIGVVTSKVAQKEGIALCIPVEDLLTQVRGAERQMRSRPSQLPGSDAAPVALKPRPDPEAVEAARREVRKLFEEELGQATLAEQQAELAETLLSYAFEVEGDPAARYALFDEARNLATRAGRLEQALRVADAMKETFNGIDRIRLELETLEEVARHLQLESDRDELAEAALDRIDPAIARDDYEAARRLIDLGRHDGKPLETFAERVETSNAFVNALAKQFEAVKSEVKTLEDSPEDARANLAVGVYYALWKGEWDRGLSMLAKAGKDPLAEIARRDLADPAEPVDQGRLGDSWWDAAGELEGRPRSLAMARAVMWYDRCVDHLPGLAKVRTRKRLEAYASDLALKEAGDSRSLGYGARYRPGLVAEFFLGSDFQRRVAWRIDRTLDFDWRGDAPDPMVPGDNFGIRWTGYLRPPVSGTYVLKIRSDNGTRWTLGGQVLYDHLTVHGQHEREITVDLKTQPQPMKVEFLEGIFTAWCRLSWRRPGRSEFEPIPADCLFHTRDQEPRAED